ncbi:Source PGD [Phytophthora ramorum]
MKRKSVYLWEKLREHIEKQCADKSSAAACMIRPLGTATVLPAQAEDEVVLWIRALRDEGVPVSAFMLQNRVLEVADALQIPRSILSAEYNFRRGFIRRHALSFRRNTRQGQIAPPDAMIIAAEFKQKVQARMADLGVDSVFNTDQAAVFFEYDPKTTHSAKGSKTVWVRRRGKDKDRVSVMLLGDSHGNKFPPYIVAKVPPSNVPATNEDNIRHRQDFGIHIWREVKELQRW